MSVSIKYKGNTIASASTEVTKTIKTAGKYCEADILVENTPDGGDAPVINPLSVTANGTYTASGGVDGYSPVTVNVPQGITPTGSITLTSENTYDVTDKASAVVDFSATRADLAEAVTAKGVDTLPTSSFDTIATNIGLISGGGSLPSSITKIDGGSFTVASDTDCRDYDISHNLGVVPKAFVVWTEDLTVGDAQSVIYLVRIHYFDGGYNTTTVSTNLTLRINTSGVMVAGGAGIAANAVASWATAAKICANYNTNYKAGITYKWLAWA